VVRGVCGFELKALKVAGLFEGRFAPPQSRYPLLSKLAVWADLCYLEKTAEPSRRDQMIKEGLHGATLFLDLGARKCSSKPRLKSESVIRTI
jgi:hypothetical protein